MIVYFVYHLDSYSGAAQQALKLAKALDEKVIFFNFNYTNISVSKIENFTVINMGKYKLLNILSIIYYTILFKIKIYHFHGFFFYSLLLAGLLKRKVILKTTMINDDDFGSISKRRFGKFKIWIINNVVNYNVSLTEQIKLVNSRYFSIKNIINIPNGVDIDLNQEIVKEKNSFCFVGLICQRKNTLESIKYFNNNYRNLDEAKLYIVGPYKNITNISDFSEKYVNECFKYVKDYNLEDQVVFTGQLSKNKTYEIYKKSKALLFFSNKEGMPNVVLEAMAHNCVPIVSSMDGVSEEIIDDGLDGFILDNLNKTINEIDICTMINNFTIQKKIQKKYTLNKILNIYKKLYIGLVN